MPPDRIDPKTPVRDILRSKQAGIKNAPLDPGSPSWNEVQDMTWSDILAGASQGKPGYNTIKKLLTQKRFNK